MKEVFWVSILALGIYYSTEIFDIFQKGLNSLPKEQLNCCASLGISKLQSYFTVVLPQVLRKIACHLCMEFFSVFKLSAIAGIFFVNEFFKSYHTQLSSASNIWIVFLMTCLIYLIGYAVTKAFSAMVQNYVDLRFGGECNE